MTIGLHLQDCYHNHYVLAVRSFRYTRNQNHQARYSYTTLPLTLLLRRNNLEIRFLLGRTGRDFLGHLAPSTRTLVLAGSTSRERRIGRRLGCDTLVSQLATTDELFGEAVTIEGVRAGVDGCRKDV